MSGGEVEHKADVCVCVCVRVGGVTVGIKQVKS